MTFSEK